MKRKTSHKLGLLFTLLSCPAMIAMAQQFPDPCYFAGWSAGVGLGTTTFMSNISHNTYAPTQVDHGHALVYKYGALGNIYIGYAGVWDNYYLGADLGLNFLGARRTSIHTTSQTANTVTATVGGVGVGAGTITNAIDTYSRVQRNTVEPMLDLKPGIMLVQNGLLYAIFGISYNKLDIKTTSTYQTTGLVVSDVLPLGSSSAATNTISTSKSKHTPGYRLGFGLEYMINPNLGIGSSYVYTWYNNIRTNATVADASVVTCDGVTGCTIEPGTLSHRGKSTNKDQEVLLQLIYHFNC